MAVILVLLQIYTWVILARIIMSWIPNIDRQHPIVQMLYQATEPVLDPVRRMIPPVGMMDISPLVVLIALHLLRVALASTMMDRF